MEWLEGARNAVRDAVLGLRLDEQLIRDSLASSRDIEAALRDLRSTSRALRNVTEKIDERGAGALLKGNKLPDYEP